MAKRAKLKTALYKNKLFVALFVLLFSGIGAYALINSRAATLPYVHVCVLFNDGSGDCVYTANHPGISMGTHIAPINGNQNGCVETYPQANGSVNYGVTDSMGSVTFACGAGDYQIYVDPPAGYTSTTPTVTAVVSTLKNVEVRLNPIPPPPTPSGCGNGTLNDQCAKIFQFTADSYSLADGGSTSLRWSSSNAGSCRLNGVNAPTNAGLFSKPVYPTGNLAGPKNYGYTLICNGTNSSDTKSLTIAVAAPNSPPPPQTCPAGQTGTPPNCKPASTGGGGSGGGTKKPVSTPATVNDTVAPTAPTNLSAFQSGPGSVDLSWDASTDNIGVDHYAVERSADGTTWTSAGNEITDLSYTDTDISFNTQYFYRVFAFDLAGNKSPASATTNITTQGFEANVTADKGATIKSDDGFVVADIPAGAVTEDAFCEITKDSTRLTPPKLKLVAGSYQINCKNSAGEDITSFEKDASINMKLKTFKGYKNFKAYTIGDTNLKLINATFNSGDQTLHFKQSDLQAFAAYGNKKGSSILIWLILPFILAGAIFALLRYRNSRPDNTYYDTSGYVSMPPSAPVTPNTGYEHHASLPELVAQGQTQAPPQAHDPFAAPVPPQYQQPGPYPLPQQPQPQDPNQPQPPQQQ